MAGGQDLRELWHHQADWLRVTLYSIGDAVVATDTDGRVTFLNPVAEQLTGWPLAEASGQLLEAVFRIINQETRTAVESPTVRALRDGVIVGLANNTLLISRDGTERPIDDSAAPIRNDKGEVAGVVLVFRDISERYRQERLVQDTLNYANNIIATLREPFLVIDGDLKVHTANPSFYKTFQVTPEKTEGVFIHDLGNGQWNIPGLRTVLSEVLSEHHPVLDYEVEHDFPDIGRRVMALNASRIRKPGNHSSLILLAIEDITARKRAEEALLENERRLEFTLETVKGGDWDLDLLTGKAKCSLRHDRCFGATEPVPDWSYEKFLTHVHPDDRAGEDRKFRAAVASGQDWNILCRVIWPDGSVHWIESSGMNYRHVDGRATRMLGMVRDVTCRKRGEAAIEVSETRYRRLFEAAKDGILVLDINDGKVTDANPYMGELLGFPHEHFLGKELWEIGLFSDKSASEAAVRELQDRGFVRYDHLPLKGRRGEEVEVEVVANIYLEGQTPVIQCNIRDTTERSRLERYATEQTEALADLHRRKDEFLAMLSHELRNPLAPIVNAVQLLRLQKGEDPIQQTARAIIERQVGQLTRLIDDLLEVSRITTGRIQLHQERFALNGVVENAVETVRAEIEQRRHALTVTLPAQPVWLYGDAARMEQVVVNLLTNAAKYSEDGGRILVSLLLEGDEAVLRVRDSGVGIAPGFLPRIFDLFTQSERSLDRSQGGLGIGLSLVQRLVEMHRGRVEAHSTLGQGSEFVVRLPVVLTPETLPKHELAPVRPGGASLRVLVVDDGRDVTHTFSLLLPRYGHHVRTASDGPAAIVAALDFRPDVVLLDIGLPGMSGFEVARRLRQQPTVKHAVLVALTGYGQEADRQRSLEAGFDHHLVKPADIRKVLEVLATVGAK